jgi:hypothetical protein
MLGSVFPSKFKSVYRQIVLTNEISQLILVNVSTTALNRLSTDTTGSCTDLFLLTLRVPLPSLDMSSTTTRELLMMTAILSFTWTCVPLWTALARGE